MIKRFAQIGIILLICSAARAQEVNVVARVDSTKYMIGEWIEAHLNVEAPKDYRIILPSKTEDFKNAEFISAEEERASDKDGRKQIERVYTFSVFDTGAVNVISMVKYYKPGDTTAYIAESQPLALSITSAQIDTTKSFRDIKDVLHVSLTIWDYLLYALIALALGAIGYFGYRWYKKRPAEEPQEEPVPERPPYEIALEKLRLLEQNKLWERGEHKAYQSDLSEIVREYIEGAFELPALEQTTHEIIGGVALLGFEPDLVVKLEQTLRLSDMAKFAKYIPNPGEHRSGLIVAYEFLDRTKSYTRFIPETIAAGEENV